LGKQNSTFPMRPDDDRIAADAYRYAKPVIVLAVTHFAAAMGRQTDSFAAVTRLMVGVLPTGLACGDSAREGGAVRLAGGRGSSRSVRQRPP